MSGRAVSRIGKLWKDTRRIAGRRMRNYTDDQWCESYRPDKYFAFVLSWGPISEKGRRTLWNRTKRALGKKTLNKVDPRRVPFGLDWQNRFFRKLVRYLKSHRMTGEDLVEHLRKLDALSPGDRNAKSLLMSIVQSKSDKIVECWLRDVVLIDAFPIDMWVRSVLKRYRIPDNSDLIVEASRSLEIPVRDFARAVFGESQELLRKRS